MIVPLSLQRRSKRCGFGYLFLSLRAPRLQFCSRTSHVVDRDVHSVRIIMCVKLWLAEHLDQNPTSRLSDVVIPVVFRGRAEN